jgi:glutamate racemase
MNDSSYAAATAAATTAVAVCRPVIYLDSGVGGLPYFDYFRKRNGGAHLVYVADNKNFPYGKKTKEELRALVPALVEKLVAVFRPAVTVIACNTASVTVLDLLRATFPAEKFVGTVPAVKTAILASKKSHIGVIGTERTVTDNYIKKIAEGLDKDCKITCIAAPDLVECIEHKLFVSGNNTDTGNAELSALVKNYVERFHAAGVDGIVLGCTHFLFVRALFDKCCAASAAPAITVFDSVEGVTAHTENILSDSGVHCGDSGKHSAVLYATSRAATARDGSAATLEKAALSFNLGFAYLEDAAQDAEIASPVTAQ